MNNVQVQPMSTLKPVTAYKTSIGKKIIMAITGFMFIGFVTGHLIGNLQIFMGQDQINTYAVALHKLGGFLWFIRGFLLFFFAFHIYFGIKVWYENQKSRPVNYVKKVNLESTFSSRTMIYSSALILFFVIYHLMHFTLLTTNPEYATLTDSLGRFDVYSMMIIGFQNITITIIYLIAVLFLGFHVSHGLFSMFQTLGLNDPTWQPRLRIMGYLFGIFIFIGYASIPAGVLLNIISLPTGGIQ